MHSFLVRARRPCENVKHTGAAKEVQSLVIWYLLVEAVRR